MRGHTVGYFSAYYRGLEVLLKMWPEIRRRVPDATLNIYYGWGSWDALEGERGRDFHERIDKLLEELKDQGVTEYGRVDHETLAEAMRQTKVWAYPTEFPEIHCITALKAQAAGCIPVVTKVGALEETVTCGEKVDALNIYSNDYAQSQFIRAMVRALTGPEGEVVTNDAWWWDNVATKWTELMK